MRRWFLDFEVKWCNLARVLGRIPRVACDMIIAVSGFDHGFLVHVEYLGTMRVTRKESEGLSSYMEKYLAQEVGWHGSKSG